MISRRGMPNAGFPKREGDRIVYPNLHRIFCALSPAKRPHSACAFSAVLRHDAGAYRAMAEAVKSLRPANPIRAAFVETVLRPAPLPIASREQVLEKLQKKRFTVCVEIDPPRTLSRPHLRAGRQGYGVQKSDAMTSIAEPWPAWPWTP